jgi:glycosyltransferase involved in cell wall biosynthesis
MFPGITPLILTYNEAPNIRRTLEKLSWAREILVVDSFSTDETLDILKSFPKVRVLQRRFDTHSAQWNFGLDQCGTPWVLTLDADYVLDDRLVDELKSFAPQSETAAYFARFRYCIHGQPLRGTLYPPRAILFRKDQCRYEQDGHTQRLRVDGNTDWLRGCINHDDRKPLTHWLLAQDRYAQLEAEKLLRSRLPARSRERGAEQGVEGPSNIQHRTSNIEHRTSNNQRPASAATEEDERSKIVFAGATSSYQLPTTKLSWPDRVRRLVVVAPFAIFFYTLLCKGLILDGWQGWYYVFQRTLAEILLSLRLLEGKLKH